MTGVTNTGSMFSSCCSCAGCSGTIEWPEFLKIFQILHKMTSGKEKATEAVEELQAA